MSDTTYQEYQYWFHAYNNAITALSPKVSASDTLINEAEKIADKAAEKFKGVKMPESPNLDMSGITDMMKSAASDAMKSSGSGKPNKKR